MPTWDIPKPYNDGEDFTEAMLDQMMEYIETQMNSTKLDGDNIQAGVVSDTHLATNSVTENKISATSVSLGKLAAPVVASLVPTGAVIPYAGTAAPSGFLMCDGSAVSRTTYGALFGVLGTTYGAGDTITTFNLPDIKGRVIAGKEASASRLTSAGGGVDGATLGATGGSETHALTVAQTGQHTHGSSSLTAQIGDFGAALRYVARATASWVGTVSSGGIAGPFGDGSTQTSGAAVAGSTDGMTSTGSGDAHPNVQPTIVLNYLIKT